MSIVATSYVMMGMLTVSDQVDEVILEISHPSRYEVSITDNNSWEMDTYIGFHKTTMVRISKEKWIITVWARKTEANNEFLLITLRQRDGKVLASESVSEPYGEVTISVTVD